METKTKIIIMERSAQMPSSCKFSGGYRKFALVEIDPARLPEGEPKMISERARGVVEIHAVWDRVFCGKMIRSEGVAVLQEARDLRRSILRDRAADKAAVTDYMGHGRLQHNV